MTDKSLREALDAFYKDNHRWSTRPCETCAAITRASGVSFGCDRMAGRLATPRGRDNHGDSISKHVVIVTGERERTIEECAQVLDREVQRHRQENKPHEFCEDYGCTSLEDFAEKIRALAIEEQSSTLVEKAVQPAGEREERWSLEIGDQERILCYWYRPKGGGEMMKREVAIFCDWNGKKDMNEDEVRVMNALLSRDGSRNEQER